MKLFLSSIAINEKQKQTFTFLVGKDFKDISFALIENAADPYSGESRNFVDETRDRLTHLGMQVERVDLRDFKAAADKLYEKLKDFDVVWFGGGNTFYLRWVMKVSGFDLIVNRLLNDGVVYGGGSAGAIVAGPTLERFDLVDSPDESPEMLIEGLGLTKLVIIPHWSEESIQPKLEEIKNHYDNTSRTVVTLTDEEAVVVNKETWFVTPTK